MNLACCLYCQLKDSSNMAQDPLAFVCFIAELKHHCADYFHVTLCVMIKSTGAVIETKTVQKAHQVIKY